MPPTDRLYLGDRIGNYRIELELSADSKATVFRAVHLVLPRRATLKVMHGSVHQHLIVNMLREACILDALQHPGVIRVYESGLHEGRPWFATEIVDAPTIREFLSPGALDRVDAVAVLRDIAEVLEHAFKRGVVHCGVRPERIMLTGRGRGYPICIADWSDARAHDAPAQQFFPCNAAWHYTSPELACGDPIDDRTDVFSLGVIAYQMLTGRLPFDTGILAIVDDGTQQHVPTEILAPDLAPELARLVDSMLAYDRWDRPSATEVHTELEWLSDMLGRHLAQPRPATGMLRIRRPRWTPQIPMASNRARTEVDVTSPTDDDLKNRE